MTFSSTPSHLVVVGAGILGLAHAVAALDAGHRVTVIEQDAVATSASVRNFGHIGASVQAGELGELAWESLPLWESLVERAGVEARRSATLAIARSAAETAVLEESFERDSAAGTRLITGAEAAALLRLPAQAASPRAGLLFPADITANPRTAVSRIAAWVDAHERGSVQWSATVHRISAGGATTGRSESSVVDTNHGPVGADHVICATGHVTSRLFPELAKAAEIRECALQMARVRAPHAMGNGPAVLTGTSMLRYGRFAGPAAEALRSELEASKPELVEIGANVMLTQQADGTLLIGDSHVTHHAAPPFLDERWSQILLDEAAAMLGARRLEVLERWQGVYATSPNTDLLHARPAPGVTVITLTTGVGMTVGLGLGARTIAQL